MPKTVDPKCYLLAEAFLKDVKGATKMDEQELAEELQRTIEDYISALLEEEGEQ